MSAMGKSGGRSVYRIVFEKGTDMDLVESTLHVAIRATGCLYGDAAVRLAVGYAIAPQLRAVVLDAGGQLSACVARVFVGLCTRELGEESFRVVRDGGEDGRDAENASP